ncbi:TerB family tellurite resistance protein [Limobrevibacterium gyesilva]|uniref:TerB family tellurite resistance protein n=1 Tax=Limobrevibacterium gyesilva TaxID=2991712 RepID=A0AA41YP05_9PROT|nr:TerB family tellurite resistance protein [Limobrevibacterium gyesilva]MCW3475882.1 TerB family tellurite resistance protein [Limobrevibacterium gyesilva]
MAGFAMGGPFGAVVGAALGHAAETGGFGQFSTGFGMHGPRAFGGSSGRGGWAFGQAHEAALLGRRDQLFAVGVVVLAAKLAKCDGPVVRAEIDAFKRSFRIPPDAVRDIGRLFDHARDSDENPDIYAAQLGEAFADNRGMLEDVLAALFAIARADAPVNRREEAFLNMACRGFGLGSDAWERARDSHPRRPYRAADEEDPYRVLGVARGTPDDGIRAAWRQLMRENHPDSLASRGVPPEFIARAGDKVAKINAAWDRIKRERGL